MSKPKARNWNAVDAHFRRGGPMKHKNTPRGGATNENRDLINETFQCDQHCTCYGEGRCNWCISACSECGGTEDQHPITKEYLIECFGEDHEEQGFFPHDFS